MKLLAIDTAANLCAACVYDSQTRTELGRSVRDIGKGHAEQLMAVVAEALRSGRLELSDMDALGVAVGPGSFTGIRVGVATARGLALGLGVPVAGVTTLEALAFEAREVRAGVTMAAIDGGRDGLYVAVYDELGKAVHDPAIVSLDVASAMAGEGVAMICGSAAAKIAESAGLPGLVVSPDSATADIGVYARLAATIGPGHRLGKPTPLYLRAPDARPQVAIGSLRTGR